MSQPPETQPPEPLYPPTFEPPPSTLGRAAFVRRCAENPLATIPASAYRELITAVEPLKGYKILWVTDPDVIEHVLVRDAGRFQKSPIERRIFGRALGDGVLTSEGDQWRWQRRALAPLFRHGEILRYVPDMLAAADETIARWRDSSAASNDTQRDIETDMTRATFDVIVRTMLYGGTPDDVDSVMTAGRRYLEATSWEVAYGMMRFPTWLPHPASFKLYRSAKQLRRGVGAIIDARRTQSGDARDLLGRLLAARDPETDAPLSRAQLVDNVATLLEAGHETTAKALTWTLYLLARAPNWQARVREEIARVTGGAPLDASHMADLEITERVIKESMRLYPPAPVMSRTPRVPVELAGHTLTPGHQVFIPIFALHRHQRLWDEPERFDPDRFTPEREKAIKRTQFMPFGAGPRFCLGASFAMIEAKALLARFIGAARFEWDGRHMPEPLSRVTLRPKGGMPLHVTSL